MCIRDRYYSQPKAWDGAEPRLKREEILDSKVGDTNNYFADPIAVVTGRVTTGLTPTKALFTDLLMKLSKSSAAPTNSGRFSAICMICGSVKYPPTSRCV